MNIINFCWWFTLLLKIIFGRVITKSIIGVLIIFFERSKRLVFKCIPFLYIISVFKICSRFILCSRCFVLLRIVLCGIVFLSFIFLNFLIGHTLLLVLFFFRFLYILSVFGIFSMLILSSRRFVLFINFLCGIFFIIFKIFIIEI